jgi:branched-chain amino acid transport system substrate-binding protein
MSGSVLPRLGVIAACALLIAGCNAGATSSPVASAAATASQAAATAGATTSVGTSPAAPELPAEATIGATMDLTGQGAVYGQMMSRGMQVAVDEINASGGIAGKTLLKLIVLDDQGQAGLGVSQMRDLVSKDGAIAIASMYSAPPLAQQSVGAELKVPVLNGGGDDPTLTGHPWLFNNVLTSNQTLGGVLQYLHDNKDVKNVGMIVGTNFSEAGIAVYKDMWPKIAGQPFSSFQTVDPNSLADATPQLQAIMATNPDAIVVQLDGAALETAYKNLANLGYKGLLVGGAQTFTAKEPATGPLASQIYVGTLPWGGAPDALVNAFQAKYPDTTPDYYGANYYNLAKIIKDALEYAVAQGWGISGESLQKALAAGITFTSGCCGHFQYNANNGATSNVEIDTVVDGKPNKVTEVPAPEL